MSTFCIRNIATGDDKDIAKVIRTVLEEHGMNKPGTVYTDPTTDQLFELFKAPKSAYFYCRKKPKNRGRMRHLSDVWTA